jgi:prepilin-type N-terminal cleavage/methylation domain-containing protein
MKIKSMFSRALKNSQGFSLIEVLISLTILTVGLLGVAGMQLMSVSGNAYGREMQMAILAGHDFLEIVRSLDDNDVNLTNGFHAKCDDSSPDCNGDTLDHVVTPDANNPGLRYTREWNVVKDSPCTNSQEITVNIGWKNKTGDHSVNLYTTKLR